MELEAFFEKFQVIAEAPGAVEKLRELVRTLAVRGGLVEQQFEEEAARTTLSAAGVDLKKWSVDESDRRFAAPLSWHWLRFAGVGEQRLGKMLDKQKNVGAQKPYLRNTNVQWNCIGLDDVKEMRMGEEELETFRLRSGDLLICEGGEPGRCAIWPDDAPEMYFQKALHRVRPCTAILPAYLALDLLVSASGKVLDAYFTGATIKHLTGRSLRAYPVAIPPLAEQKRIVAKVDSLMALCDQLEARQQERQTRHAALTRASLARFAEEPTSTTLDPLFDSELSISPEDLRETISMLACERRLCPQDAGGETTSLAHLVGKKSLKNGLSLRPSASVEKYACLPISSLRQGVIDLSIAKPTDLSDDRALPFLIEKGDVFVVRGSGSKHLVGQAGLVDEAPKNLIFPDLFIRVPIPVDVLAPRYFVLAWNSSAVRVQIVDLAKTTSGIWKVNQTHVSVVKFPLPPLPEQRRIVARVDQLMARVDELESLLASSRDTARDLLDALVADLTASSR